MDYKKIINEINDSEYLISMVPAKRIVELGYNIGMNKDTTIFDICCEFGAMLSIWNQAFDSQGLGIDLFSEHISLGKEVINKKGQQNYVKLIEGDAKQFKPPGKYDVVSMVGEDLFRSIPLNLNHMEKFRCNNGVLIYGTPYAIKPDIPKELIEFEGPLLTLNELYNLFKEEGYIVSDFATCEHSEWERYVGWSARRDMKALYNENGTINKDKLEWIDLWYKMYFNYRKDFEGFVIFTLRKI